MDTSLIAFLSEFVTPHRFSLFKEILSIRTRYISVVLEDIYQSHNASAVLRSCDGFGIQDIHIIENRNKYNINPDVSLGSQKWLSLYKYNSGKNNTPEALHHLRKAGYRIVATTPHEKSVIPDNIDLSKGKIALVFGTELNGLSETALKQADEYLYIPMFGFTESFNISVSAAIILYHLTRTLKAVNLPWQLTQTEKDELLLTWLRNSIKNVNLLEKKFRSENE